MNSDGCSRSPVPTITIEIHSKHEIPPLPTDGAEHSFPPPPRSSCPLSPLHTWSGVLPRELVPLGSTPASSSLLTSSWSPRAAALHRRSLSLRGDPSMALPAPRAARLWLSLSRGCDLVPSSSFPRAAAAPSRPPGTPPPPGPRRGGLQHPLSPGSQRLRSNPRKDRGMRSLLLRHSASEAGPVPSPPKAWAALAGFPLTGEKGGGRPCAPNSPGTGADWEGGQRGADPRENCPAPAA